MAEDIAKWMNIPADEIVLVETADLVMPDVVIVIGQDFVLPGG